MKQEPMSKLETDLMADIQQLHTLCVPIREISRKLHLPEADIRFAIQRHRLPQRELSWREVDNG